MPKVLGKIKKYLKKYILKLANYSRKLAFLTLKKNYQLFKHFIILYFFCYNIVISKLLIT
jgi:hypothetical protein